MHVGQIYKADCANGTGIRISLFVSGCTIHCKGCFNARTWDFDFGVPYDDRIENLILEELSKVQLIRRIKKELPKKNIWMFSGYVYDRDLVAGGKKHVDVTDEILDSIDVLVDGPFMIEKKNITLRFRGSENQRIIDMKETRKTGSVVLKME